jgi:hypothetical protein
MHILLAVLFLLVPVMSDGFPNDEDIPATFSANRVVGDVYPQGADLPGQQFVDTISRVPLLSLNSNPSAGDVGFGSGLNRGIQTGVLNGDFSMPPPSLDQDISASNPLPYWTFGPISDGLISASLVPSASYGSGYYFAVTFAVGAAYSDILTQTIDIPASQGQQWRVLLSFHGGSTGASGIKYQFLAGDGSTIGSEVTALTSTSGGGDTKVDAGLVPTTAAALRIKLGYYSGVLAGTFNFGEVRAAFLPAEASLGLGSLSASSGGITTTETQVKGITIPADTLVVGSVYRIEAWATMTSSAANVVTMRMRLGPTTLTGTVVEDINPTATTTASSDSFKVEALLTVRSVGATGTVTGGLALLGGASQPFANPTRIDQNTGTVTIDTTVANILEFTAQTAAGTTTVTFRQAVITCLMAS